jgi:hypothetical protein
MKRVFQSNVDLIEAKFPEVTYPFAWGLGPTAFWKLIESEREMMGSKWEELGKGKPAADKGVIAINL